MVQLVVCDMEELSNPIGSMSHLARCKLLMEIQTHSACRFQFLYTAWLIGVPIIHHGSATNSQ